MFDATLKGPLGFINHRQFALLYTSVLLAVAPVAHSRRSSSARFGVGTRNDPADWPTVAPGSILRLAAMVVAVPYTFIGVERLLQGGLTVFTGDALPMYIMLRLIEPGNYVFNWGYSAVASQTMIVALKIGFALATCAEIVSILAIFKRRIRRAWLAIIVPFHLLTLFTMNIFFWENLVLIAILFTELPSAVDKRVAGRRCLRSLIGGDQ